MKSSFRRRWDRNATRRARRWTSQTVRIRGETRRAATLVPNARWTCRKRSCSRWVSVDPQAGEEDGVVALEKSESGDATTTARRRGGLSRRSARRPPGRFCGATHLPSRSGATAGCAGLKSLTTVWQDRSGLAFILGIWTPNAKIQRCLEAKRRSTHSFCFYSTESDNIRTSRKISDSGFCISSHEDCF